MNSTYKTSSSMLAARKRVALALFLAMLLITLGAEISTAILGARGILSLLWPMAMLLLAIYWLRLFLSDWMRRVQLGKAGDDSLDEGRPRARMLAAPCLSSKSLRS